MAEVSDYILGMRHLGIVTTSLEETVDRLQEIFAIAEADILRLDGGDTRFAFFAVAGVDYEVIEPVSDYFRKILLNTNLGTNHVCYNVSDLDGAVAAMAEKGVRLGHVTPDGIVTTPSFRMAYFDPRDTANVLIEMVESQTVA